MYFGVYGEGEVKKVKLTGKKSILIRISKSCELKTSDLYDAILELNIDDVVDSYYLTEDFKTNLMNSFFRLNLFLLENDFDEIIVHCALGISRSPAVMICIAKILGCMELEEIIKKEFKLYNKIIVDLFQAYPYIKKDINVEEVNFKGHFIREELFDDLIEENENCLTLKLKL